MQLEPLPRCAYHLTSCSGDHKTEAQICMPNAAGLCVECYIRKFKARPPAFKPAAVPGVEVLSLKRQVALTDTATGEAGLAFRNEVEQDSRCQWRPDVESAVQRGYRCCNSILRHPSTQKLLQTCGWHVDMCVMAHRDAEMAQIAIPNKHGLCTMHHLALSHVRPVAYQFPYPGMSRMRPKANDIAHPDHPLAPQRTPPADLYATPFKPAHRAATWLEGFTYLLRWVQWKRAFRRKAVKAAIKVQAAVRMWLQQRQYETRLAHSSLRLRRREQAALDIQNVFRSLLGRRQVQRRRKLFLKCALLVQRTYRRRLARTLACRHRCALTIQRLVRAFLSGRMIRTVVLVVQVQKLLKQREAAAVLIQKVARGWLLRRHAPNLRGIMLRKYHLVRSIQRAYRARTVMKNFQASLERLKQLQQRRRNAHAVKALIGFIMRWSAESQRTAQLRKLHAWAALILQRTTRGMLHRLRTERLRVTRDTLWRLVAPRFAKALICSLVPVMPRQMYEVAARRSTATPLPALLADSARKVSLVRPYLPAKFQRSDEVHQELFRTALTR
jgi:hypothetical protein